MIRFFLAALARRAETAHNQEQAASAHVPENFDALIARRAERVMNRKRKDASAYVRTHQILARGRNA
jgi:hypothetical protein